jgi:hypothetical protein
MILIFQIVVAFQGTYEEKILKKYDVAPLQAIGWEGNYLLFKCQLLFSKAQRMFFKIKGSLGNHCTFQQASFAS